MIIRIVKLPVSAACKPAFMAIFDRIKHEINKQPGCQGLQLYEVLNEPGIIFTYSRWENEEALNGYRESQLFKSTWPDVKKLFSGKAQAWTLSEL